MALGRARLSLGDDRGAEEAARAAAGEPSTQASALALLAAVQAERGDLSVASSTAQQAMAVAEREEAPGAGDAFVRLIHAETLLASGRRDEAARAVAEVASRLRLDAHRLEHARHRRSFLEGVPEHARLLELECILGLN